MKQFWQELIWGGKGEESAFLLTRLHALEDGKISLSALFVALGFFVTIGFVGNAEMAVFRKLETQNAADSMALTCSTWRARGMNAVTANNHLMGEISAVITIIEALGGPELDGQKERVEESVDLNKSIKAPVFNDGIRDAMNAFGLTGVIQEFIPVMGSSGTFFRQYDSQYVDFLIDEFTRDEGEHDAGATIYDGKMSLKALLWYGLSTKLAGNVLYVVASAISLGAAEPIAAAANLGAHVIVDGALIFVVKDWYLTIGVELAATVLQPLRDPVLPLVLRGLSLHGDSLADRVKLREATEESLKRSQEQFRIAEFETFPQMKDFTLPVEPEAPPERGNGRIPNSLSNTKPKESMVTKIIKGPIDSIQDAIDTINDLIPDFLSEGIGFNLIPERKDSRDLPAEDGGGHGFPGSHSLKHLREYAQQNSLDWQEERSSQWVRATFPHVDELRRSFREMFDDVIPTSGMASHFVHWTNRYTVSVAHRMRSADDRHLYVLVDAKPDAKGNEPWTANAAQAEELFAVQVYVKRATPAAILTPPLFPNPNRKGGLAISESLVYNANGRRVTGPTNVPGPVQPDTGWDTLNWAPPVKAPEWGGAESSAGDGGRVLSMFSQGHTMRSGAAGGMRLNWQSKLVPIGTSRFESAIAAPSISEFFEGDGAGSLLPDPSLILH